MDGNQPFWLFLGVVALLAAFALIRKARRRRERPGAPRWGRDGGGVGGRPPRPGPLPGFLDNGSGQGPGDGGASDDGR
jgi:hypothetical protein